MVSLFQLQQDEFQGGYGVLFRTMAVGSTNLDSPFQKQTGQGWQFGFSSSKLYQNKFDDINEDNI